MAEKYAPEELEAANSKLLKCHEEIKNKNYDEAKKLANESTSLAKQAYDKSVPFLAKDTIAEAEKNLEEANEAYSESLAKSEYEKAEIELKNANDFFQNKKHGEAYESALKANELAKSAKETAMGKKELLNDEIVSVKEILDEAKKHDVDKYAKEKYNLAKENLDIAVKCYEDLKLKKGFSAIEVAKINANDALSLCMEQYAKNKLAKAEMVLGQAEKSPGASAAKDELSAAKESNENAKKFYEDTDYKNSIASSDETIRLATLVLEAKDNKIVAVSGENDTRDKKDDDSEKFIYYKVKYIERKRDCLWRISRKFYKNPWLWKKIYAANSNLIKNPNLIKPGWVLKIPKEYIK